MKEITIRIFTVAMMVTIWSSYNLSAQDKVNSSQVLNEAQKSIISIAASTARGELQSLKPALNKGLDAGLTVNEIKEVIIHLYAYCGFPRSIRGLQTFMEVLEERKVKGINDITGADASPVKDITSKYERGKKVLGELTNAPQERPLSGYNAFAPVIDTFLKEHLFADLFERDVLTYAERELVTISVLSSIGAAEPMLRSHLSICLNVGLTPAQLNEFVDVIKSNLGEYEAEAAKAVLNEVLKNSQPVTVFAKGDKINSTNFTGTVWLKMMGATDSTMHVNYGKVTFDPGARTNWHSHPGGQLLLITGGTGYYQAKGEPARLLRKGDYVEIPPNIVHWHGAGPDTEFAHIAISLNTDEGGAVWLQPVTDEEYGRIQ
jgi:quercetin dioxygenase-like cupin family protein/alkylhydroperoxidase/carboxymuconolactone decarboxylase family protein YurZ